MPNIEITQNDTSTVELFDITTQPDTLTATGEVAYVAGTLLGRITASGKLAAYTSGAADGSENPVAVLAADVSFADAGDKAVWPIVAGKVRKRKLVAHGVGAVTVAEADALRDYGIIPIDTVELTKQDNE